MRFGDVEVLASCFSPKGRANVATGRVRVNGLDLDPRRRRDRGRPRAADDHQHAAGPGASPAAIPLYAGRIAWDLSSGRFELPIGADAAVRFIRLTGTATVVTDGLGRFRIGVLPRIDSVFERFAARLGAVSGANLRLPAITGDAVLRTENARGLSVEALHLTAASIPIGLLEVRSLVLDFEPAAGNWLGTAKLKLPGPPPQVIADATVVVRDGAFQRASLVAGNSLGTYGFGVRLERLALDVADGPVPVRRRARARRRARRCPASGSSSGSSGTVDVHRGHALAAAAARALAGRPGDRHGVVHRGLDRPPGLLRRRRDRRSGPTSACPRA